MTLQKLASAIAFREGKKSQARIGDIREILKVISTMEAEDRLESGRPTESATSPLQAISDRAAAILEKLKRKKKKK